MHKLSLPTVVALLASASVTPRPARADAPLPPPAVTHFCNHDKSVCVTSDPGADGSPAKTVAKRGTQTLWTMARWFREGFLSPDGRSLVDVWDMMPVDVAPSEPVIRCYRDGMLLRQFTLTQLVADRAKLRRTVSHLVWLEDYRDNSDGTLDLVTVEDRKRVLATQSCTLGAAK